MCDIIKTVFPKVLIISQIVHTFRNQIQAYLYKDFHNHSQIKAKVQIIISNNLQSPTNIR